MLGAIAQHYVDSVSTPSWTAAVTALAPPHWYKLEEASGTTLTDSGSSPSNGATAASNITHNVASLIPGNTSGKSKTSASGGQIDTGTVAYNFSAGNGFTMVWTYKGTTANVVGNGETVRSLGVSHLTIQVNATDFILAALSGVGSLTDVLCPRGDILDGTAHLLVFTVIDNSQKFYVDGTLKTTLTRSAGLNSSGQFRFARSGSSAYLSGGYDDFVFVNSILTPTQVADLYASWLAPAA